MISTTTQPHYNSTTRTIQPIAHHLGAAFTRTFPPRQHSITSGLSVHVIACRDLVKIFQITMDMGTNTEVNAVSVKIPPFWPQNIEAWFACIEAQFSIRDISSSKTKFFHVISGLSPDITSQVLDVIQDGSQSYENLKIAIINRLGESQANQLQRLHQPLSPTTRPSLGLHETRCLLGSADDKTVRKFFLNRLPPQMQMMLANHASASLSELTTIADKIYASMPPHQVLSATQSADQSIVSTLVAQVSSLTQQLSKLQDRLTIPEDRRHRSPHYTNRRRQSPHYDARRRQTPSPRPHQKEQHDDFCWYHKRYNKNARNCVPPCSYAGN